MTYIYFIGSEAVFASAANYNRSDPDGPVWLRDVECTGSADSLFGCYDYNPDTRSCKASQDIGVVCSTRGKEHVQYFVSKNIS